MPRGLLQTLVLAVAGAALLVCNTARFQRGTLLTLAPAGYRFWVDFGAGTSRYLGDDGATTAGDDGGGTALFDTYRELASQAVAMEDIEPWQFWRTVAAQPFRDSRRAYHSRSPEDPGRAVLLALGFVVLGGIAPFLLFWLAPLLALPLLAWIVAELVAAGRTGAAAVFAALFASSLFVVGVLTSSYSPVGFYVLGLLAVAALAIYAALGPGVTWRGLFVRGTSAALVLAIAVACRAGTLLLLPGLAAAAAIAVSRIASGRASRGRWRRALLVAAVLVAIPVGAQALRAPGQGHVIWMDAWSGLGDFDRTGTHRWSNAFAKKTLRDAGRADDFETSAGEAFFRHRLQEEVRAAPLWYTTILGRRLVATLTQQKLWPWAPWDGASMAPSTAIEEGAIDDYYRLVPTVDQLALGPWRLELPIAVLIAPTLLLAALCVRGRREGPLGVLACVGLASLALPVVISTAGAFETQAFALTYFLGAALLTDEIVARVKRPSPKG